MSQGMAVVLVRNLTFCEFDQKSKVIGFCNMTLLKYPCDIYCCILKCEFYFPRLLNATVSTRKRRFPIAEYNKLAKCRREELLNSKVEMKPS